jgi:NAD(P)-dependent dehydrogenase (short-subunit alcohol dehydrogenase family)
MTRTVIITGAASGIGLACVEHQLALGWRVALMDRDATALEKARGALARPRETVSLCVDVTDEAVVNEAVAAAGRLAPIRGLINSAAVGADQSFEATSVERFRKILDVNVIGSFIVARGHPRHSRIRWRRHRQPCFHIRFTRQYRPCRLWRVERRRYHDDASDGRRTCVGQHPRQRDCAGAGRDSDGAGDAHV